MGNIEQKKYTKQMTLSIDHPYLKNASIVHINHESFIKIFYSISKIDYLQWIQKLQKYRHNNYSKIFLPLHYTFRIDQYCGSNGKAQIIYPNYAILLNLQFQDREKQKNIFSQQFIWYLMLTILKAKEQMIQNQKILGDIRPQNVIMNEQGFMKIIIDDTWPQKMTKSQKVLQKVNLLISPEEAQMLTTGEVGGYQLRNKSQMFSLGFTLLSLGNLLPERSLYDYEFQKFNVAYYNQAINYWINNKNYSLILKAIVLNLISLEPKHRISSYALRKIIIAHQKQIAQQTNFVIEKIPSQLNEEIEILNKFNCEIEGIYHFNSEQKKFQTFNYG